MEHELDLKNLLEFIYPLKTLFVEMEMWLLEGYKCLVPIIYFGSLLWLITMYLIIVLIMVINLSFAYIHTHRDTTYCVNYMLLFKRARIEKI